MRQIGLCLFIVLAFAIRGTSQIVDPVKWKFSIETLSANELEVIATATIDEKWHVYALKVSDDPDAIGPIPTSLKLNKSSDYEPIGSVTEGKFITHFDPNFEMDLNYFENTAKFKQKVKITSLSKEGFLISGVLEYMACDDSRCIFPEPVKFKVKYNPVADESTGAMDSTSSGIDTSMTEVLPLPTGPSKFTYQVSTIQLDNPRSKDCSTVSAAVDTGSSLWELFLLGFIGGLLALLTPCVFPMIPLTVSFFTKGSENKRKGIIRAITYGSFIFFIYIILSLPFHLFDQIDENILNNISTNVPLNIGFFIIFVFFAFSFFGYYEITLPSSFANKMDNASNVGGLIGSFFMALTLAIVSFSCTGPILGSLLAGSLAKDGGAIQLTAGMGGFGLALGIPFAVFAAFPGMLKSLPKSGGWLNSVKVVLGFLELALALKFLSQVDLVDHWGVLKYELFIGLWIVIFLLMAIYIFGKIKFPHDSPLKKLGTFRIVFGVVILIWVGYLATGFRYDEKHNTYHSLRLLSGLAPPVGYSWIYPKDCPHNIDCEHDYQVALERSKKEGKPLFIDFTGYACVNCRKMEEHVWIEPVVLRLLQEEFIVVSLYVDDRKELPAELQETYLSQRTGKLKEVKTYGDRWSVFQTETFNNNSQPLYCIVSPDEILMNKPAPYTPDKEEYLQWMECGLQAFKQTAAKQ